MAYRGEDLDLRTSQNSVAEPAALSVSGELPVAQSGNRSGYHSGPILVDETVLACCNYAYDVALANRSTDVRVEHLLNAMSRLDAAATALEHRGVRVAALRRETAMIIASEIPTAAGNGSSPHRSDELAHVLRAASSLAARRNAVAGIDDLMQVLIDQHAEFPAGELLVRFTSRVALRDGPDPLPPLTRLRHGSDNPRSHRGDFTGSPTDAIQNSRIEALEQMVRALSQELSIERHTAVLDARGTNSNKSLVSKLESIEAALELRLQEMSQSWSVLSKRLQDLEASVRETAGSGESGPTIDDIRQAIDLKPISNRLDIIEEAVLGGELRGNADLGDRFAKLEGEVTRALSSSTGDDRMETLLSGIDRVDGLSAKLDAHHTEVNQASSVLAERLSAVESAIAAEIETATAKHQAYASDLSELHEALLKLNQNQHTLAGSMDQWRTDSAADVANILNRLTSIDRDNALPVETLNGLNAHMETMNRLIIERYHRRNRFRYWLFGTDDWIGASWPSQKAAIEAERQRVKSVAAASST